MRAVAISKQGSRSEQNEDACIVLANKGVFAVADGVGGGPSGGVASRNVVDTLREQLVKSDTSDEKIRDAFELANQKVRKVASDTGQKGMASTLVLAWVIDDVLRCYHVGDSRIYRIRNGEATALTKDHAKLVRRVNGSVKSVVTQAMGAKPKVAPEVAEFDWEEGDIVLLMSDGISDPVADEEMAVLMSQERGSMADRVQSLINRSEQLGGTDDKTVVAIFS
ncbi:MAG: protein phosphatase 2C domain-containing protein [Pseudomonadales bacterium]|nr:protein phosphatase 2C domain-containing protein [Pseudomonadales bacterium]